MRFVAVANRLPVKIVQEQGKLFCIPSPGGVASGLRSYLEKKAQDASEYLWVGWPGAVFKTEQQQQVIEKVREIVNAHPVFLTKEEIDAFYNGFCNKVIWPLFHYFPTLVQSDKKYWDAYVRVNEKFADEVAALITDGDIISIHDYQLLLLPQFLRKRLPRSKISFFLHIPFPTYDIFRILPDTWRKDILNGMLGADIVGFHTTEYAQNFLTSALRLLGREHRMGQMSIDSRSVQVRAIPLGVDAEKIINLATSQATQVKVAELKEALKDKKIIFSVDRLDYSKGISQRLLGYERFLRAYPQWQGRVVLLVSSEPSRVEVEHYKRMRKEIEEIIGRINGEFGTLTWTPVIYQFISRSFEEMVALFSASDVALITPLRDGMNLISKEYIASKTNGRGVLILSEMAGSARELGEALIINPYDISSIAEAIQNALTMPETEQKRRLSLMQQRLLNNTVFDWAEALHKSLLTRNEEEIGQQKKDLLEKDLETLKREYAAASRRLIFLDYDGTLAPFAATPEQAVPSEQVLSLLKGISEDYHNEVVLISGRTKETLQEWFPFSKMAFVAEHGVWRKERQEYYWVLTRRFSHQWKRSVTEFLSSWVLRAPGSFIEEKTYSLAWHYRLVDPTTAQWLVKELLYELITFTANIEVEVVHGDKVIEVKNIGADKGTAAQYWLNKKDYDFILALGDDATDEDLFRALPHRAWTIKVGEKDTLARKRIPDCDTAQTILASLIQEKGKHLSYPVSYA